MDNPILKRWNRILPTHYSIELKPDCRVLLLNKITDAVIFNGNIEDLDVTLPTVWIDRGHIYDKYGLYAKRPEQSEVKHVKITCSPIEKELFLLYRIMES